MDKLTQSQFGKLPSINKDDATLFTPIASPTVKNIVFKLIIYSMVLLALDTLIPHLYGTLWAVFATVFVLTAVGTVADETVLPALNNIPSLSLGFIGMTVIIWLVALFWPDTHVTFGMALILALCLAPFEFMLHKYVLGAKLS